MYSRLGDFLQVDRVLKPGGVIAATMYSYDTMVVNHSKQTQLSDIVNKVIILLYFSSHLPKTRMESHTNGSIVPYYPS